MRRSALALMALALTAGPALAAEDLPAVGTVVPPYPTGVTSLGGACAGPAAGSEECDLSVGTLDRAGRGPFALYAGRRAGTDGQGQPTWAVTDTLRLPPIPDGHYLAYSLCRVDRPHLHPVAILRAEEGVTELRGIAWAAALDRGTGRFVALEPGTVTCENPLP